MDLYPNMPIDALLTWAEEFGVEHILHIPARMVQGKVLEDHSAWLWVYKQSKTSIQEVICRPTATGAANQNNAPLAFQVASITYLQEAQQHVQKALEEEVQLLKQHPPNLPALQDLWSRLLVLRSKIRNVATPRRMADRIGHRIWVEENPPTIIYKEESQAWCGDQRWPELRIDLQSNPTIMRCHCTRGKRGQCSIGLSAIDTILQSLSDPQRIQKHKNLEQLLSTPRWSRQLMELDKALTREPFEKQLGWRVKILKNQGFSIEPIFCSRSKEGEWKQKKIEVDALLPEVGIPHSTLNIEDQNRLRLLWPEEQDLPKNISNRHRQALIHMAIATLNDRSLFFLGARSKEPATIQKSTISITGSPKNGMIQFSILCSDIKIENHEFASLLNHRVAGGIWILPIKNTLHIIELPLKKQRLIKKLTKLSIPLEAYDSFCQRIPNIGQIVDISLSKDLEGTSFPTNSAPIFQLELKSSNKMEVTAIVRPIHVAYTAGQGISKIYDYHNGKQVVGERDFSAELQLLSKAITALSLQKNQQRWFITDPDTIIRLFDALKEKHYRVEWIGCSITEVKSQHLKTKISVISQGFTIEGNISLDGEVPLQNLLVAVRENRPFINIEGAKWLMLSSELRRRLLSLADAIQPKQNQLFLSQQHIPVVEQLLPDTEKPTEWIEKAQKMKNPTGAPILKHFHTKLRPYQEKGYHWLHHLSQWAPGACLADDMGLGKTIQTLAFLSTRSGPFLIVGPTSLASNWYYETRKFCPKLNPSVYRGTQRKNILLNLPPNSVIITSYSILTRDIEELQKVKFSIFVLDEAQAIKNPQTARSQSAQKIHADFVLTLTGTPIENHLTDLWSLFRVSNPGLLGSQAQFFKRFIKENRRAALAQILSPFLLRRLKSQVASDLPERIEIEDYIDLSLAERDIYNKAHLSLISKLNFQNPEKRFQMLAALTKLRQIACHPRLVDSSFIGQSSKIERCIDLLLQMKAMNRNVLIFSQFVQLLKLLRERLQQEQISFCYLDGSLSLEKREEQVQIFQQGKHNCFLISLKAGGSGLNLTTASEVILLDPWWNPAVEAQAADRSHRIGQKKQVSIYRLISRNTIEASILQLHRQKRDVAAHLLQDRDQILSFEEIRNVLTNSASEASEKTAEESLSIDAPKNENRSE